MISIYLLFKLNKLKFKQLNLNQSILNLFSKSTSSENFNNQLVKDKNDYESNPSLISGLKNFTWSGNNVISKSITELESDDSSLYSDDTDDNTVYSDITNDETSDVESISDSSEDSEVTLSKLPKSQNLIDNRLSTLEKKKSSCGCKLNSISNSINSKVIETFSDLLPDNTDTTQEVKPGQNPLINYTLPDKTKSGWTGGINFLFEGATEPPKIMYSLDPSKGGTQEFFNITAVMDSNGKEVIEGSIEKVKKTVSDKNMVTCRNTCFPYILLYPGPITEDTNLYHDRNHKPTGWNDLTNIPNITWHAVTTRAPFEKFTTGTTPRNGSISINFQGDFTKLYMTLRTDLSRFDGGWPSTLIEDGWVKESIEYFDRTNNVPGLKGKELTIFSKSFTENQSPASQQSITNVSPRVNQDSSAVLSPSQSPASQYSMSDQYDLDEDDEEIDDIEVNNRINIEKSPNSGKISTNEFESSEIQLAHISNNLDKLNDNLTDSEMIDGSDEETNDIFEPNKYKTVENMLNQYMTDNKECNDKLLNDISYEKQFNTSYKNYVSKKFKENIGKVPDFTDVENLNDSEFKHYINILKNLPKCEVLMNNYDTNVAKSILNSLNYNSVESSDISRSSNQIRNRYDHNIDFDNTDKLRQNQEILDNLVKTSEEKLFVDADNTENKMFNDKVNTVEVGKSFNYKPNIKFDHNEPSIKTASAYGWSYMPPQTWSVPQKRPPVCIPDHDTQSTVKAIYDKGTPVDALDWVKSGAILPQNEYTEKYNENYYYPGWKAQEHINYPFKDGNKGPQEYYNYNLANKIE